MAFLTESWAMGGVERATILLLKAIDRSVFDPILICQDTPEIAPFVEEVRSLGVAVVQTPLLSGHGLGMFPARIVQMARLLRRERVDLLHIQMLGGTGSRFVVIAARVGGIRVVLATVHGFMEYRLSGVKRWVSRLLDGLVTLYTVASEHNRVSQIDDVGRRPDQLEVIYNAIDMSDFDRSVDVSVARRELGVAGAGPVIATLGRLASQKGAEYFLEMAESVSRRVPDATFVLIGDGYERDQYEQIAIERGLSESVRFVGHRPDGASLLVAADVVVVSSVFEPFGLVVAEAMAMHRPIVATRVGGIPEVVVDGQTALLVPSHDGEALADAVLTYLDDPALAHAHAAAGYRRVHDLFTLDRLTRDVRALYSRFLPDTDFEFDVEFDVDDLVPLPVGLH